jgi:FKBP-type peptidyl-prolyl cis-trans isomerase SlyD
VKLEKGKVVAFHYRLTVSGGSLSESSPDDAPVFYLHGSGNIIPGLEEQLAGHAAGDRLSVTIPPEKAYGLRNPYPVERVPIKHVQAHGPLRPGARVAIQTSGGLRQVTVAKVGRYNVDVDPNHPLAGKTLSFDIEIVEVRDARPEELEHGHAHGPSDEHH